MKPSPRVLIYAIAYIGLSLIAAAFPVKQAHAQTIRPLSKGWYRLPYGENWTGPADGEVFEGIRERGGNLFNNGHNGYDVIGLPLQAWNSTIRHEIVAMADGIVCQAVDCWSECSDPDCGTDNSGLCPCNNLIWIEHPNGEFSTYLHIAQDSLKVAVGDCVVAGQHIADEGDVGSTAGADNSFNRPKLGCDGNQVPSDFAFPFCGVHLHYGVFSTLNLPPGPGLDPDLYQVIPRFCGISDHVVKGGGREDDPDDFGNCDLFSCAETHVDVPVIVDGEQKVIVASNSITSTGTRVIRNSVIGFEAGNKVTLKPGFRVEAGSYFRGSIGSCYSVDTGCPGPNPAGCPDPMPITIPPCPVP